MIKLESKAQTEKLLDKMGGFHDALVRQIHVKNPGFVDDQGAMHNVFEKPDLALLIHSQFVVQGVAPLVMVARGVTLFRFYELSLSLDDLDFHFIEGAIELKLDERYGDDGFRLHAAEFYYHFLPIDQYGEGPVDLEFWLNQCDA